MAAMTSRARAARAPALAAAAVLVVVMVAGAVAVAISGGGDAVSGPPPLRLPAIGDAAASRAGQSAMQSGVYRLEGELPVDGPEQGVVWQLPAGPANMADIRRLATALGLEGEPRAEGDSWTVEAGDVGLHVSGDPGRWWSYGPVQEQFAAPPEGVPAEEVELVPVSEAVAREVAAPVLAALGLDVARARTEGYGNVRGVVVDPDVAGLPTQGWSTRIDVDGDGALLWGSGWLGAPTAGETYPLVGAQAAYDLMAAEPHPDIAAICLPDTPCGQSERVVTGARPGLQLNPTDGGMVLVPAWLFDVRDAAEPVGHVAVEPAFLAPPAAPELPVGPPPADGPVERTTFGFDRAARGVQEAEVVVGYGDSSSCPHVDVVPLVEETDQSVTVRLEADAQLPERACTADYVGVDLVVPLQQPLGDRVLVDGVTGVEHDLPAS